MPFLIHPVLTLHSDSTRFFCILVFSNNMYYLRGIQYYEKNICLKMFLLKLFFLSIFFTLSKVFPNEWINYVKKKFEKTVKYAINEIVIKLNLVIQLLQKYKMVLETWIFHQFLITILQSIDIFQFSFYFCAQ